MKTWNTFFHNFRINILARIFLICTVLLALVFVSFRSSLWTLIFWLGLLTLALIIELIRYLEKFKERFIYFLDAINQNDFTLNFQLKNQSDHDRRLAQLLNDVIRKFKHVRSEMEARQHLLKVIIEQVNVGIIVYDNQGEIILLNEASKKLLNKPFLNRLEGILRIDKTLYDSIQFLDSGRNCLVKFIREGELLHLSLQATEIRVDDQYIKVITLHDIRKELDEKEVDAWQKLVRVINHEIMNSVIPITTLANVLHQMLMEYLNPASEKKNSELRNGPDLRELCEGIRTIEDRSKGLTSFVGATKSITNLNNPEFRKIRINEIIEKIPVLLGPELKNKHIRLNLNPGNENGYILADPEMIEQVLINLIRNAQEALENKPEGNREIEISSGQNKAHVMISVKDNGCGISEKELDNIFVPFYTTKQNGSGIGLPLSRQIMKLHKGSIAVRTVYGEGTEFSLIF